MSTPVDRRHFITQAAALGTMALAGASTTRLWAAPGADARFLLVFLRGGYDALNLLVPTDSAFYREVRPNIAISSPSSVGDGWGLHPSLNNSVLPLVQKGQASFIPFAGVDNLSRSHFETQDALEMGQPRGGSRDFRTGFMNRLAVELGGARAIAFTDQLPVVLRGTKDVANLSLKTVPNGPGAASMAEALSSMYRQHPLQARIQEGFGVRAEVAQDMSGEMQAASRGAITARGFELEARRIARVMRERFALGFVDIGGWDTHTGQGSATGYLASRLEELGRGLAGFADEIGEAAWKHTTVVVVSEFGRTVRENGSRGTDHGRASVYWVLGGGLSGKPVVGEQLPIEARHLFQNRDLPVLNDHRSLLGGLFSRQFGLDATALERVFPSAQPRDLGLI